MSLLLTRAALAASAAIVLCVSSAAGQQETISELKLLQQRKLFEAPAKRIEGFETRRAETPSVGSRWRTHPQETDLVPPSGATPSTTQSLAALATNYRINDRTGEPEGAGQSGVSIAAHGSEVVAAWNDGIGLYDLPTRHTQGYGYSTDGGVTWVDGGAPPAPAGLIWVSDPVIVVNERTGVFYYSALIDLPGDFNGVAVAKGVFQSGSFAWGMPTIVRSVANSVSFLAKPWLAADSLTGNLYVAYSEFPIVGGVFVSNQIRFQRSTDDNQSWNPPQTLSSPQDAGFVQGARPGVGPDGELYVVWHAIGQTSNSAQGRDFLRVRKSIDGGISFASQVTADSVFSNFPSGAPGFNRPVGLTFPGIAVDRSNGPNRGRVYVTWHEAINFYADADRLPNHRTDPGINETENNNSHNIADVFTPGLILRGAVSLTNDLDYWRWDATQGTTYFFWLDSMGVNLDASFRIFCSDGVTNLAFNQNGVGDVNGGELLVFTAPSSGRYYLRVASYQQAHTGVYRIRTVTHAQRVDDRARDHRDIFVKSSPNGITWGPSTRVNDSPPGFDDWLPEIAVNDEGRAVVAAYDWRDSPALCGGGSNAYLYVAEPSGAWGPGQRVSDVTTNWTTTFSTLIPNQGDYIGLFARDGVAHVAWGDGREGDPDVETATVPIANPSLRADAGDDTTIECQGPAGTPVRLDGTGSTGATSYFWSAPGVTFDDAASATPTGSFPLGGTVVTLVVGDGVATAQDEVQVGVIDTSPPQVTLVLQPAELWPPSGALATVQAQVEATDVCDPSCVVRLVSIDSDEPDSGTTPGDRPEDIQGADLGSEDFEFQLRSERAPTGNGRTYTVCFEGEDQSGNVQTQCAQVQVPRDQSGRATLHQEHQNLRMIAYGNPSMPASSIDVSSVAIGSLDFLRFGTAGRAAGEGDYDRDGMNDLLIDFDGPGLSNVIERGPLVARWTAGGTGYLAELTRGAPLNVGSEAADVFLARVTPNPGGDPLIRFALPHGGRVRLDLFDVTGQRVARIVDGVLPAGWHEARYRDPRATSSRLLLYRLEWEGRVISGKLALIH